jgi:zinc-ribbon domain
MFCSGCGHALVQGQPFCPKCGRPVAPVVPPVPGFEFQLQSYAGKIKALSVLWFVYSGLSVLFGLAGMAFAAAFFHGHFGPWMHGPWSNGFPPPDWFGPAILHFAWVVLVTRTALALAAGWGLMERSEWGRVVAIVAAVLGLLKFPFGTALGIWTLVVLLGYRNSTLYDQLP